MKLEVNPLDPLLRHGYFPKELPPTFHSRDFAGYVLRSGKLTFHGTKGQAQLSIPAIHNLARPGQLRRTLKVFNPFNQYELARIIADGWSEIESHLSRSNFSASRPMSDPLSRRAFITEKSGGDLLSLRADRRAVGRYLLKTDIARFYHTIYTHSIPWALDGKSAAKANRTGGLGNELDRALRNGQDGQTLGIPVGPDTSLIIAEIVATCIDTKIVKALPDVGFRFIDDFELTLPNRSQAESALAMIEEGLADFELAINPLKTAILPLPQPLDRKWTSKVREYEVTKELDKKDLLEYFNMVFNLSLDHPGEPVIPYAVGRLRSTNVEENAWTDFQNLLFQCAVAEPASLPIVLGQLHRHQSFGVSERLPKVLNEIACTHSLLRQASEVAWALWTAIWYNLALSKDAARAVVSVDDPFVSLLALHAREAGLVELDLSDEWDSRIKTGTDLYNRNWLLMYEGHLKGWLPSLGRAEVANDPHFGPLLEAEVSFYDIFPDAPVSYLVDVTGYGDLLDVSTEESADF